MLAAEATHIVARTELLDIREGQWRELLEVVSLAVEAMDEIKVAHRDQALGALGDLHKRQLRAHARELCCAGGLPFTSWRPRALRPTTTRTAPFGPSSHRCWGSGTSSRSKENGATRFWPTSGASICLRSIRAMARPGRSTSGESLCTRACRRTPSPRLFQDREL